MCKRTTSEYIGDTLSNILKMLASHSIKTVGVNRWSCCEVIYMGFDFNSDTPR